MDLIYTNADREDVGVLKDYVFDLAFGSDENDFELTISTEKHCCADGCLVYIEDTEYGGIIDGIKVVTRDESLTYYGRTWHGVLESKIIQPDSGKSYLTVTGEANEIIGMLINRIGLSDLFEASTENSGLKISNYSFDRYIASYTGIKKMLSTVSGKLKFTFKKDKVILNALPLVDYSQDEQFDDDQVEIEIAKSYNNVNHLICLGKGELTDRQVVHLYLDEEGNISETQTFTGIEEHAEVYEYTSAESLEELTKSGKEKLQEYISSNNSVKMDFESEAKVYDIGDIIGASENVTGITIASDIAKKIVRFDKNTTTISYECGKNKIILLDDKVPLVDENSGIDSVSEAKAVLGSAILGVVVLS